MNVTLHVTINCHLLVGGPFLINCMLLLAETEVNNRREFSESNPVATRLSAIIN